MPNVQICFSCRRVRDSSVRISQNILGTMEILVKSFVLAWIFYWISIKKYAPTYENIHARREHYRTGSSNQAYALILGHGIRPSAQIH